MDPGFWKEFWKVGFQCETIEGIDGVAGDCKTRVVLGRDLEHAKSNA